MSTLNKLLNFKINKNKENIIKSIHRSFSTSTTTTTTGKFNRIYTEVEISKDTNKNHLEIKKKKKDNNRDVDYIKPELIERAKLLPHTSSPLSDTSKRVRYNMLLEAHSQPILGKGKQHLYNFSTESIDPVIFFQQNPINKRLAMSFIQHMGLSNHPNRILETIKLLDKNLIKLDLKLYNNILSGFANCKDIDNCLLIFERMLAEGITPNNYIFNSLITAHMNVGKVDESFQILRSMEDQYHLVPDHINYTTLMNGLVRNGKTKLAIQLFSEARIKGMQPDSVTLSVMVDACAKEDLVEKAFQYYEEFKYLNLPPTEVTFNSLINACAKRADDHYYLKGFELLQEMSIHNFSPDIITFTSLMNGAANRGEVAVFEKIYRELLYNREDFKHNPDTRVFSLALLGYANNQILAKQKNDKSDLKVNIEKAEKVFKEMQERGVAISKKTLNNYLKVYSSSGFIKQTKQIFDKIYSKYNIQPDVTTFGTMIRMYVDHRKLETALELLYKMRNDGIKPDYFIYLTLLHGCAKLGYGKTALKISNEMNRVGLPPKIEDMKGILLRFREYPEIHDGIKNVCVFGEDDDYHRNNFFSSE
ncbi:hypothetical protein ACTA71_007933 [Dictyostelium dimigraforme]